jgi:pimeloyl-ACP methyl ester carboxylesterase
MRLLLITGLALAGLVVALAALLFVFQRRLVYFPTRTSEEAERALAARLGLVPLAGAGGARLGWTAPLRAPPLARLLVMHGNAGAALDRLYYVPALAARGVEVTLLEYPGYGSRPGEPTEESLTAAALEAVEALAAAGPEPLWLLGESLGSGVASRAARLRPGQVAGLLLVTPFARLVEVAKHHYPLVPSFLLRDRWAPIEDLTGFGGPVAVVIAGRDEVVTTEQGRRLYASLAGPRRAWEQPDAGHNTLELEPRWPGWDEVIEFLRAGRRQAPRPAR